MNFVRAHHICTYKYNNLRLMCDIFLHSDKDFYQKKCMNTFLSKCQFINEYKLQSYSVFTCVKLDDYCRNETEDEKSLQGAPAIGLATPRS